MNSVYKPIYTAILSGETELALGTIKVKLEVLNNILIEFCTPKKLVRLIKMCLGDSRQNYRRMEEDT